LHSFGAGLGYYFSLPGVGDAEARVHQVLAGHHDPFGALPLPTKLGEAVVAVEDEHFYSNVVMNVFDGGARGASASLHTSGDPGGSTIAQQLAKQLYAEGSGFGASLEEIGLGVKARAFLLQNQRSTRCT
jgi:membrane peptidoglycan carboxypeptidase